MRLSANRAMKTKSEAKKLSMFSKTWVAGDVLHAVYPIFWDVESNAWQLLAGGVWGYQVSDIKLLNLHTAFIPALTEFSEDGSPIGDPDVAYKFSKIAKTFVDGQKAADEFAINQKKFPNETMRKEALQQIADKYDTKNNRKAIRPIISHPQYLITTECVVCQYKNGTIDTETAKLVSQPLSDKNIKRLGEIISDSKFTPEHTDQETDLVEVEWVFPSDAEKAQSAINSKTNGLEATERTAYKDPEAWKRLMNTVSLLSDDSDVIVKRATHKIDETRLEQAITQYCYMQSQDIDALDLKENEQDIEALCKNIDILQQLQLTHAISNKEILDKLNDEIEKSKSETPATESIPTPVPDAPSIEQILNNSNNAVAEQPAASEPVANTGARVTASTLANANDSVAHIEDADMEAIDLTV